MERGWHDPLLLPDRRAEDITESYVGPRGTLQSQEEFPTASIGRTRTSLEGPSRYGILYIPMEFEFDPAKSTSNRAKHGISFEEATQLWGDPDRLEAPAKTVDEARYALIAQLHGNVWVAIFTYRQDRIRIISVRRARPNEKALYDES